VSLNFLNDFTAIISRSSQGCQKKHPNESGQMVFGSFAAGVVFAKSRLDVLVMV